jgi:hypothetical protein
MDIPISVISGFYSLKVLWNPRWTKRLGLTGGDKHEQFFSKLYLYAYVLKNTSKISKRDLTIIL